MRGARKVSVLIPAYNHAGYIEALLDSVAADGYENKEVVIIDDGSVDGTCEKIEQWLEGGVGDLEVRFRSRRNRGLSATLNELIELATGDYVAIIASDDYLLPGSVSRRAAFLDEHDAVNAVFGDCVVVDEAGQLMHESGLEGLYGVDKRLYSSSSSLKRQVISRWSVPGGTLMARKEVFDTVRFDERYMMEDRAFFLRLVALDWLAFMDVPLAAYRLHGDNVSRSGEYRYRMAKDASLILLDSIKYFDLKDRIYFIKPVVRNMILVCVRWGRRLIAGEGGS